MKWLALLAVLAATGCMGTSANIRSAYNGTQGDRFAYEIDNYGGMTPEGREILTSRLRQQLGASLGQDGDPAANRIRIRIDYYRMRHGAVRFMVGIMAGQDRSKSTVTVSAPDGTPIGTIVVDSKNPTAMFTAKGLIEDHADEIVAFVKSGKASETVAASATPATPPTTATTTPAPAPTTPPCKACKNLGKGL